MGAYAIVTTGTGVDNRPVIIESAGATRARVLGRVADHLVARRPGHPVRVAVDGVPAPPPGATFTVTGAVGNPLTLTAADLRRFPAHREWVRFESGDGVQRHHYTGARLFDALTAAGPRFDPAIKNHKLVFAVLVTATDGYRSVVAWAEFDPDFAGTDVLLAYREDGKRLDRPRLVVPGDRKGGRYVSAVTEVQLIGQP
jgi:DMSO/TMAO reductase YedYZ molybdopterin-dependent catalytic subunit